MHRTRVAAGPPALAFIAAALVSAPASARAQDSDDPGVPSVTVTGEGFVQAAPEVARVRIGVLTEAPTARAASGENATRMERVIAALRSAGIEAEAIQTVQFTIEPAYDYDRPEGRPVLRGFQARNLVEARTRQLKALGSLLDAAIDAGGNAVEGVRFELEDPGAAQSEALQRALADARRKAESLAGAAGRRLGEVERMVATYGRGPGPWIGGGQAMAMERAQAAPPVSPGELTVSSTVDVTYRLD